MNDEAFLLALGETLRSARRSRGLTLRDVEIASEGSLRGSAVGGWERGQRSLSVRRFVELALLYGFGPDQLLRDALERTSGSEPRPIVLDLTRLGTLPSEPGITIGRLAQEIKTQRGDYVSDVLSLRRGDLEVWAANMGTTPQDLAERLHQVLIRND